MTVRAATRVCPACGAALRAGAVCPRDGWCGVPAPRVRAVPDGGLVGALVDGRYRVVAEGARGGLARVYRATHVALEQAVALKVLDLVDDDPGLVADFLHEARTTAALRHPNVVPVLDFGVWAGAPYLVMPWVDGGSLEGWVRADRPGLRSRLRILTDVLAALDEAHEAGLVHCDVKPTNVLVEVGRRGVRGLLADFGVARLATAAGVAPGGTPLYMAPEQLVGKPVGPETDVFATGCLAWALLTGSPPHRATRLQDIVRKRLRDDPPALASVARFEVPSGLGDVIARALARPRDARWPGAAAFRAALLPWLAAVADDPAPRPARAGPVDLAMEQTLRASPRAHRRSEATGRQDRPPVGREEVAARLEGLARDALHEGRGSVVLLTGEAGLGRTRLVRWLSLRLAADPGVRTVSLRCLRGSPSFHMVRGALTLLTAGLAGIHGPVELAQRLRRLHLDPPIDPAAAWRLLDPPPAGVGAAAPPPSADVARWLHAEALRDPVALLLDDAEWCDAASCAVLHALAACLEARPAPLLLVAALRTGAGGAPCRGGAELVRIGGERTERLALTALDRHGLDALIDNEWPDAPPDVRDRLWELTAGHPLFARSLLRGWAGRAGDAGPDEPGPGPGVAHSARAPLSPALAQSLLSWVDDAVADASSGDGGAARELLAQLAVLGREPQAGPLVERYLDVLGWDAEARDRTLDDLAAAGLLVDVGHGAEERLAFSHDLVREALDTVVRARPRRLRTWHRAAADALRERCTFDDPEPLARRAEHLAAAGDAAAAAAAWARAARVAELNGTPDRAAALVSRGLSALADAEGPARAARGRLHLAGAALAARRGDLATTRDQAGRALADLLGTPDEPALTRAASLLARGAALSRERDAAVATLRAAAARLRAGHRPRAAAACLFEAGALRLGAGDAAAAAPLLVRAAALAGLDLPSGAPLPSAGVLVARLVPLLGH